MTKRLDPTDRKAQILTAALTVAARKNGWASLTRESVAKAADVSEALPSRYFGTMVNFRRDIMRAAIRERNLSVIGQGLAAGDKYAKKAPDDLKREALTHVMGV